MSEIVNTMAPKHLAGNQRNVAMAAYGEMYCCYYRYADDTVLTEQITDKDEIDSFV